MESPKNESLAFFIVFKISHLQRCLQKRSFGTAQIQVVLVEGECFMTIVSHGAGFPFAIEENLTLILILCITWIYQKLFLNNDRT